jgi:hypothetical protein
LKSLSLCGVKDLRKKEEEGNEKGKERKGDVSGKRECRY